MRRRGGSENPDPPRSRGGGARDKAVAPKNCGRRPGGAAPPRRPGPSRRPCATAQTRRRPVRLPAPPPSRRIDSCQRIPSPRLVVVRIVQRQVATTHRLFNDAAALGDVRSVVGAPHFVVKQLAARIAQQLLQLRRRVEQPARPVQLLYALGQSPEQRDEALRSLGAVNFFAHCFLPERGNPRPCCGIIPHNQLSCGAVFHAVLSRKETPCMGKKRGEPRKYTIPTSFEQARDELFSHILRCGVLEASLEHQKEWFDDTLLYLADRFADLTETELN